MPIQTRSSIIRVFCAALLACAALPCAAGELKGRTPPTDGVAESVWVSMKIKIPRPDELGDAKGLGLILIDPELGALGEGFSWDEPGAAHSIGIGFDVSDPPPGDIEPDENGRVMGWFDEMGNWYDRPQREVSVHVNGRERLNVLSPVEFRSGRWMDVAVQVRFVLGGARVLVRIDGTMIIDEPVWDVRPMNLLASAGVEGGTLDIKDLRIIQSTALAEPMARPIHIEVFDEAFLENDATLASEIDFSRFRVRTPSGSVGRVIATLTLSEPEAGYDHWDKKGSIGVWVPREEGEGEGGEPERFEVFRFITPFRRGWSWHTDVTDLLPLFADRRRFDAHIGTYMKGWDVSFSLDFYPGALDQIPFKVVNLWNGDAEIGNPENPVEGFYVPREVPVPDGVIRARVRATVTGHGMDPNSKNAGEFMPIWRTLTVSSGDGEGDVLEGDFLTQSARDYLWKTDVYLNPCRPQRGTWKFDRAGWAPGSKVEPWIVDTQSEFIFGDSLRVEYTLDPYLNENRGQTWSPHHWTDAVLVFYRDAQQKADD